MTIFLVALTAFVLGCVATRKLAAAKQQAVMQPVLIEDKTRLAQPRNRD
jgi:hypothetical protein